MGSIVINSKIEGHVSRLFKKGYVVLDNKDALEKSIVASMVQRFRELRKHGGIIVAYDDDVKRTVFVLSNGVKVNKLQRYHFGGKIIHYVLTGRD